MKNIFLAPRSNETSNTHFGSTILDKVPYDFIAPFLNDSEKKVLSKYEKLSVWGNKASIKSSWDKMKPGDYVLFYKKGFFYYSATVILTKFNEELARKLWNVDKENEMPWPCLFFVDNLKEIQIPIELVRDLAEYEPTWDRVQKFMPLHETGIQAIKAKFGSIENFIKQDQSTLDVVERLISLQKDEVVEAEEPKEPKTKEELLKQVSSYSDSGEGYVTDEGPRKRRKENKKQKEAIAALEDYRCQLCGWELAWKNSKGKKVYRIDIDHIIDKSKGGGEEASNLWALCPNHHVMKTLNVIKVDLNKKKVFKDGQEIELKYDNHLGWL